MRRLSARAFVAMIVAYDTDAGWGVENYGTDPDYDVDVAPQDYRDGKDPQLDTALGLMEQALAQWVEVRPDLTTRPSLPLPTLT